MTNYILIAAFSYPSELAVAKTLLEENDIPYQVRDELTVQVHNFISNAIGGIRLEVPEVHAQEAIDILVNLGYRKFLIHDGELSEEQRLMGQKVTSLLKITIGIVFILVFVFLVWVAIIFVSK
ncbi:putative signal transducing protein [Mangrovimonas sp. TPBH4]|uniref:putative signal transducing protein n=1 Tax=Mangrovimonas sp. TPBH4 TaxID=1645914 RepID=UPI0006B54C53|nr:DUF2007 domain-containing protein [Mangrovimonas sp. TPBH4]